MARDGSALRRAAVFVYGVDIVGKVASGTGGRSGRDAATPSRGVKGDTHSDLDRDRSRKGRRACRRPFFTSRAGG